MKFGLIQKKVWKGKKTPIRFYGSEFRIIYLKVEKQLAVLFLNMNTTFFF